VAVAVSVLDLLYRVLQTKPSTRFDVKAGMTLMVTIVASGHKLPLFFITKGTTMRCTTKLSVPQPHIPFHSKTGWMTETCMLHYMDKVILPYTSKAPAAMILDAYTSHLTPAVRSKAKEINLQLLGESTQHT
jgi:hypothetical protein